MELRNPLTRVQADSLYEGLSRQVTLELADNHVEESKVGSVASDMSFSLEYYLLLPISRRSMTGQIGMFFSGGSLELLHEYNFSQGEIHGVEFYPRVSGSDILLGIRTELVGENPVLVYKRTVGISPV